MSFDVSTVEISDTTELKINDPRTGEPFMVQVGESEVQVEREVEETDPETGETKKVKKMVAEMRPVMKPMSVVVYGPGSKVFKAAQAVSQKTYNATFNRGKSRETPEQQEARVATFLSACTVEFRNFNYKGLDSTDRETFRALYLDPKAGWITEQVNQEMGDWANFTGAAPTS